MKKFVYFKYQNKMSTCMFQTKNGTTKYCETVLT